jgi:hypothetical protein
MNPRFSARAVEAAADAFRQGASSVAFMVLPAGKLAPNLTHSDSFPALPNRKHKPEPASSYARRCVLRRVIQQRMRDFRRHRRAFAAAAASLPQMWPCGAQSGLSGRFLAHRSGLPTELFLGILSTSWGSARSRFFQVCHPKYQVAVRPRRSASIAVVRLPECCYCFLPKVRDEKSHRRRRVAQQARSSVERDA